MHRRYYVEWQFDYAGTRSVRFRTFVRIPVSRESRFERRGFNSAAADAKEQVEEPFEYWIKVIIAVSIITLLNFC